MLLLNEYTYGLIGALFSTHLPLAFTIFTGYNDWKRKRVWYAHMQFQDVPYTNHNSFVKEFLLCEQTSELSLCYLS